MEQSEYITIPIKLIPNSFIDEYDLWFKAKDRFYFMEIEKGMYGLQEKGLLAN